MSAQLSPDSFPTAAGSADAASAAAVPPAYTGSAAGWGALRQVAVTLLKERVPGGKLPMLLSQNQPEGFDCPGCAWPDRNAGSSFQFCENGVKAVAAESTSRRVGAEFFRSHTVTELMGWSDYELERQGRLTDPMVYDAASDRYLPIAWNEAYELVAEQLRALPDPDQAAFYTSGRASNEAAYLFQLLVRAYGTNNFPDCSNMCHEATSRGLPATVGVGKATVTLEDFEHADTLLLFGQNPGTNHPRMLGELRECARRGATIVSINPLRERGLERFTDPQSPREMLTLGSTRISSVYIQPKVGGDLALMKGVAKHVLELDDAACDAGAPRVLDVEFIAEHTSGFAGFAADLRAEDWERLVDESGVARHDIEALAGIFARGQRVIATWGMGLTQHKHALANVQMLSNLLMMRGQIGKPGAGLCPVRGHSNVQGDRTMGIEEKPTPEFLDRLREVYGFEPPRHHGLDTVETIDAMLRGEVKVFFALGGNFAIATPDTPRTWEALRGCELTVQVSTKLNRSHLIHGRRALILPTLGRTEIDEQQGVAQGVTVEDSVCMVHLSYGRNRPASPSLRSEVAIVAGIGKALLGDFPLDWDAMCADYDRIRDEIARAIAGFEDFNARVRRKGGFHLRIASRERRWLTAAGKAQFLAQPIERDTPIALARRSHGDRLLVLTTLRSHDQYNTTIYDLNDRYRGVQGRRDVLFIHPGDRARLGFAPGQRVDVRTVWHDGVERCVRGFALIDYDIPAGCLAAYFPETNVLVPLDSAADGCGTPTSKSIPVLLSAAAEALA